jgi:dipeptidyl aminopeptidase/acylaminoacyl peptidase
MKRPDARFANADEMMAALDAAFVSLDQLTAPVFIYQGENDAHIPRAPTDQMVRALRERGTPVEYMVPTNEGHTVS